MDGGKRVAIVTGAGSGIGSAVAVALVEAGFFVALTGRRSEALEQTQRQTDAARTLVLTLDVSDPHAVTRVFDEVARMWGRIDVLFNNAGVFPPGVPFADLSHAQWTQAVNVNLSGAFFCAQAAFRQMQRQRPRGGRIINNGSVSAHAPRPNSAPYTATKHAITGLTKSIALDGRAFDIACGQIDIGNAATEMAAPMAAGILQANGSVAVEPTMDLVAVARAVVLMATLPPDANVPFMTIMATKMPLFGRG